MSEPYSGQIEYAGGATTHVHIDALDTMHWRGDTPWHPQSPKSEKPVRLGAFVAAFNERGEVLLVHRRDIDVWEAPGGTVEPGEAPWEAAVREVREEAAVDVAPDRLVGLYWRPKEATLVFQFAAPAPAGRPSASDEADDVRFFAMSELPKNLTPVVRERLRDASRSGPTRMVTQAGPTAREFVEARWTR